VRRWLSFLLGFTLMWGYLGTRYALSHEDYTSACCGGKDCHPVACEEIENAGLMWRWHGFTIEKWRAVPSSDGGCHVCVHMESHTMICIYLGGGV
jgi:hypothetical protein